MINSKQFSGILLFISLYILKSVLDQVSKYIVKKSYDSW